MKNALVVEAMNTVVVGGREHARGALMCLLFANAKLVPR